METQIDKRPEMNQVILKLSKRVAVLFLANFPFV